MSNLKDLVPPLELCKMIPAGEFGDTALMCEAELGMASRQVLNIRIIPHQRITNNPYVDRKLGREYYIYPASTLQEIMEVLPHDDAYNDLLIGYSGKVDKLTGWHIYYNGDRHRHCYDQSAVTAALKLWLKVKGVMYEQK